MIKSYLILANYPVKSRQSLCFRSKMDNAVVTLTFLHSHNLKKRFSIIVHDLYLNHFQAFYLRLLDLKHLDLAINQHLCNVTGLTRQLAHLPTKASTGILLDFYLAKLGENWDLNIATGARGHWSA